MKRVSPKIRENFPEIEKLNHFLAEVRSSKQRLADRTGAFKGLILHRARYRTMVRNAKEGNAESHGEDWQSNI